MAFLPIKPNYSYRLSQGMSRTSRRLVEQLTIYAIYKIEIIYKGYPWLVTFVSVAFPVLISICGYPRDEVVKLWRKHFNATRNWSDGSCSIDTRSDRNISKRPGVCRVQIQHAFLIPRSLSCVSCFVSASTPKSRTHCPYPADRPQSPELAAVTKRSSEVGGSDTCFLIIVVRTPGNLAMFTSYFLILILISMSILIPTLRSRHVQSQLSTHDVARDSRTCCSGALRKACNHQALPVHTVASQHLKQILM